MFNAMLDPHFNEKLEQSCDAVCKVGLMLLKQGKSLQLNAPRYQKPSQDLSDVLVPDDGDIWIVSDWPIKRVEVKHQQNPKSIWTSAEDYPWDNLIIYSKPAWDRMVPKAEAIYILNKPMTHAAVVAGDTWQDWQSGEYPGGIGSPMKYTIPAKAASFMKF